MNPMGPGTRAITSVWMSWSVQIVTAEHPSVDTGCSLEAWQDERSPTSSAPPQAAIAMLERRCSPGIGAANRSRRRARKVDDG